MPDPIEPLTDDGQPSVIRIGWKKVQVEVDLDPAQVVALDYLASRTNARDLDAMASTIVRGALRGILDEAMLRRMLQNAEPSPRPPAPGDFG